MKLVIQENDRDFIRPAEYRADSHSAVFSKEELIAELFEEPLNRLMLHELGHACDQAIYYSENPAKPFKLDSKQPLKSEISHLKSRFGAEFVACLDRKSKRDEESPSPLQLESATEAFAEAVFSPKYKSALDWGSLGAYGGYLWASQCILETPRLKALACGDAAITVASPTISAQPKVQLQ